MTTPTEPTAAVPRDEPTRYSCKCGLTMFEWRDKGKKPLAIRCESCAEIPAAIPPMCECGHDARAHLSIGYVTEDCRKCDCPDFRAAPPAGGGEVIGHATIDFDAKTIGFEYAAPPAGAVTGTTTLLVRAEQDIIDLRQSDQYWLRKIGGRYALLRAELATAERERDALRAVVWALADALATRCLADANAAADDGEWPAGQSWDDLGASSRSSFRRRAYEEAGLHRDAVVALLCNEFGEPKPYAVPSPARTEPTDASA